MRTPGAPVQKGDEEVVVTGKAAGSCDFGQNLAYDAAQRVLSQNVVANMVLPHVILSFLLVASFPRLYAMAQCAGKAPATSHVET